MPKLNSKSREVAEAIGNHQSFDTYGALRGTTDRVGPWDSGQLAGPDLDRYRQDMASIHYTVFSYSTPIAWVTENGTVHKVQQKFSRTTSAHQGKLYLL